MINLSISKPRSRIGRIVSTKYKPCFAASASLLLRFRLSMWSRFELSNYHLALIFACDFTNSIATYSLAHILLPLHPKVLFSSAEQSSRSVRRNLSIRQKQRHREILLRPRRSKQRSDMYSYQALRLQQKKIQVSKSGGPSASLTSTLQVTYKTSFWSSSLLWLCETRLVTRMKWCVLVGWTQQQKWIGPWWSGRFSWRCITIILKKNMKYWPSLQELKKIIEWFLIQPLYNGLQGSSLSFLKYTLHAFCG